jgi:hypothetical protein
MNKDLILWLESRLNKWLTIDLWHREELENLLAKLKLNS